MNADSTELFFLIAWVVCLAGGLILTALLLLRKIFRFTIKPEKKK